MKKHIALAIALVFLAVIAGVVIMSLPRSSDNNNNISVRISKIDSDGTLAFIRFELKYTDGSSFQPGETVSFSNFTLTANDNIVIRGNVYSDENYYSSRCKNKTSEPTDTLEGFLTVRSSEIAEIDTLKLSMKNMITYIDKNKEINFSITDYLAQHPELNKQIPVYNPSSDDISIISDEPKMKKGNLDIRLSEDTDFVIDNLCVRNGFLFIRIKTDEMVSVAFPPNLSLQSGNQYLMADQVKTLNDANYFFRVYRITDEMIKDGITIKNMNYRSILHKTSGNWEADISKDNVTSVQPKVITTIPGIIKVNENEQRLAQLTFTDYSIRIALKQVSSNIDTTGQPPEVRFFRKDGLGFYHNFTRAQSYFPYDAYYIFDPYYSGDDLGAIVFDNTMGSTQGAYYVYYDFDFSAGTCKLETIEIGEGFGQNSFGLSRFISDFYAPSISSVATPVITGDVIALPRRLDNYVGDIGDSHLFTLQDSSGDKTKIYLADFNPDMALNVKKQIILSSVFAVKIRGDFIIIIRQNGYTRLNLDLTVADESEFPDIMSGIYSESDISDDCKSIVYIDQHNIMLYDSVTQKSKALIIWTDLLKEDQLDPEDSAVNDYYPFSDAHFVCGSKKVAVSYGGALLLYNLSNGTISKTPIVWGPVYPSYNNDKGITWLGRDHDKNQMIYYLDYATEKLSEFDTGLSWGNSYRYEDSSYEHSGKNHAVVCTFTPPDQVGIKPVYYLVTFNTDAFSPVPLEIESDGYIHAISVFDNGQVYFSVTTKVEYATEFPTYLTRR